MIADAQRICQTAMNSTSATSGGSPTASARRHHGLGDDRRGVERVEALQRLGDVHVGVRVARPAASAVVSGMAGDHLSQPGGDLVVQVARGPSSGTSHSRTTCPGRDDSSTTR